MKIKKEGISIRTNEKETIEYKPIESVIVNKPADLGIDDELFIARILKSKTTEYYQANQKAPFKSIQDETTGKWLIVSQNGIDEYLKNGELVPHKHNNEVTGNLSRLAIFNADVVKKIEENDFFLLDKQRDSNVATIEDDLYTSNEDKLKKGTPLRLVNVFQKDIHATLQTGKNKFISSAVFINTDSDNFNLEKLVKVLEQNKQFRFLKGRYNRFISDERIVEPLTEISNNKQLLADVIERVPHYNQNNAFDLHEISGYFSFNQEQIKSFFLSPKGEDLAWMAEYYQGQFNEKELKNVFFNKDNKILIYALNAEEAHVELENKIISKKITPQ